jgi:hypothetical protein
MPVVSFGLILSFRAVAGQGRYLRRPVVDSIERTISISIGATRFSIAPRRSFEAGMAQLNNSGRLR